MRRSAALASLSRDHHEALVLAQKLRRATPATVTTSRESFLAYWQAHGQNHFRLEEEILFPAYAAHGDPHHALIARALCDHVGIRHHAQALAGANEPTLDGAAEPTLDALHELGHQLAAHVRLEERQVFPLIEQAVPSDELAVLARALSPSTPSAATRRSRRVMTD
jgi:hemerythrin-like domain-containing protein